MNRLYFNNAFSKQPLAETVEAMRPYLRDEYEHPLTESASAEDARAVLNQTRQSLADLLTGKPGEFYLVSCGTEANNWALKGSAWNPKKNHMIISAVEHFSVYQTAQFLSRQGCDLTVLPVDSRGLVDPDELAKAVRSTTFLISIQSASDEIGVIQDIDSIARLRSRFPDVLFHTDAVQYLCYEELNLSKTCFDLVTLSSNALYGPAGIAALYIREGTRMVPLLHGGMQEEGMRPGLQSIALAAGFQRAVEINRERKRTWKAELRKQQESVFSLLDRLGVPVTGERRRRLADNIHCVADVDGEAVLTLLLEEGIRASSGSTCYAYAGKESHVLKAIGISSEQARGALLFTLPADLPPNDLSLFQDILEDVIRHLRKIKP